jgi:hypothetical protein
MIARIAEIDDWVSGGGQIINPDNCDSWFLAWDQQQLSSLSLHFFDILSSRQGKLSACACTFLVDCLLEISLGEP